MTFFFALHLTLGRKIGKQLKLFTKKLAEKVLISYDITRSTYPILLLLLRCNIKLSKKYSRSIRY